MPKVYELTCLINSPTCYFDRTFLTNLNITSFKKIVMKGKIMVLKLYWININLYT